MVLEALRPETLPWSSTGPHGVHETEVLQHFMRNVLSTFDRISDDSGLPQTSEKNIGRDPDIPLRNLQTYVENRCSSLRRESHEQCHGEPSGSVRELSWFLARVDKETRDRTGWKNAVSFPLTEKCHNRVGALRGSGNAIVPQIAARFVTAFMEAKAGA
jgi:hypothetical protein